MDAYRQRKEEDLKKIQSLCRDSSGKVFLNRVTGDPPSVYEIEFRLKTAGSASYPRVIQQNSTVKITLSSRYPLQAPTGEFTTPIYHPNVYASGLICLGQKWVPTEGLDLLAKRIIQIIIFDPAILNLGSPANGDAAQWYTRTKSRFASSFPTDAIFFAASSDAKKIVWK